MDAAKFASLAQFKKFVDNFLLHRCCTSLDTLWLRIIYDGSGSSYFSDYSQIQPWVCHALRSNVQVLGIVHPFMAPSPLIIEGTFNSAHLKKLHLCRFEIIDAFVSKLSSGCPALEELELIHCDICVTEFSSTTLKRLTVTDSRFTIWGWHGDLLIDMPNLVSLCIKKLPVSNPYLVDVSSLETATIYLDKYSFKNSDTHCNVLSALSNAASLESLYLTVHNKIAIKVLARDVLRCGTLGNLRTLSLGEWCLGTDCSALLHLLRRSPKIEKLILNLTDYGASNYDHPKHNADAEANSACNERETPFSCGSLKKILINCPRGDKRADTVARILFANITSKPELQINPSKRRHVRRF